MKTKTKAKKKKARKPDVYDREVARLRKNPDKIFESWGNVTPLFGFVTPNPQQSWGHGCLTMIRGGRTAYTSELTEQIQADERIPRDPSKIRVRHLPIFAAWQRKIDKELGRSPLAG